MIRTQANYATTRLKYTSKLALIGYNLKYHSVTTGATKKEAGDGDDARITQEFRAVVNALSQAPQTPASEAQLDIFMKNLQKTSYFDTLTPVLYKQVIQALVGRNNLTGAEHCNLVLARHGILPRPDDWPELLSTLVNTNKARLKQSAFFMKIFHSEYPVKQAVKKQSASAILSWLESCPTGLDKFVADTWFYTLLLLAPPESTKDNMHIIRTLFSKKLNSTALDQRNLYRTFLKSVAKGHFYKNVDKAYIHSFMKQISRMQPERRESTARRFIYAIKRFDSTNGKRVLTVPFWVTLVKSKSGLETQEIEKLVNSMGLHNPTAIYEAIILNTKDFLKCNNLYEKYFAKQMNEPDHFSNTPEKQMSLNVYSYLITLLCSYSPKDAHEIARNPSVYDFEQLARGYFVGLLQARDYPRAIEYYRFLESKNRVSNNIWNLYVFALTKTGNVKLAVKLATEALYSNSKCDYKRSGISSSNGVLDNYEDRQVQSTSTQVSTSPATDTLHIKSPLSTEDSDPFANFRSVVQPARKPNRTVRPKPQWSYAQEDLQPCKYSLSVKTFRKVAQAIFYYNRIPPVRTPKKQYVYGQVRPVDRYRTDMVLYKPNNYITDGTDIDYTYTGATKFAERFPAEQIVEFLKLGWYLKSENSKTYNYQLTTAGMQLPPETIMRILLDIKHAKLWYQRKELITIIYALAEVYPRRDKLSENILLNDNGKIYYQHDLFTTKFLSTLITLGYVKSPMAPWVTLALLSDLVDRYALVLRPDQVQSCLQNVMVQVHHDLRAPGELRRARWQARGFDSLQALFDEFNAAWLGNKANDFKEIVSKF